MWSLLILASILTVTSRASPVTYSKLDRHNEILIPSENLSEFKDRNGAKYFPSQLRESEFEDTNDTPMWEKFVAKYEPSILGRDQSFTDIDSNIFDTSDEMIPEEFEEAELNRLSNFLSSLLRQRTWRKPLVLIDESDGQGALQDDGHSSTELDNRSLWKRSRYNRRYPWKRQTSRSRNMYDYEPEHLCTPSREDVLQLLVAIHNVRQGNKSRTVNFCNRRRPVGTVFTNIRFLGRRK